MKEDTTHDNGRIMFYSQASVLVNIAWVFIIDYLLS